MAFLQAGPRAWEGSAEPRLPGSPSCPPPCCSQRCRAQRVELAALSGPRFVSRCLPVCVKLSSWLRGPRFTAAACSSGDLPSVFPLRIWALRGARAWGDPAAVGSGRQSRCLAVRWPAEERHEGLVGADGSCPVRGLASGDGCPSGSPSAVGPAYVSEGFGGRLRPQAGVVPRCRVVAHVVRRV